MHKKRSRRQQIAIRFFTYGMMALFALLGVAFCLAWAMGFRIDLNDGKLTQVALLQFNSFPTGATVDINGQSLSSKTPTRANVKSGETSVIMSKEGYRSWRKTVNMLPSSVVWLNYARLIPNSITTDTTRSFAGLSEIFESPDKKWLLLRHSDNNRYPDGQAAVEIPRETYLAMPFSLTLADISNPENVRFSELTIPSDKITWPADGEKEFFSIVEWDKGSRFMLIKHLVGETTEYLELDRANAGVVKNLTRDFGLAIDRPHFSGTSGNVFFGLTGGDLRKFDYGNNTASAPLVSNVKDYHLYENGRIALLTEEITDGNCPLCPENAICEPCAGEKITQTVGIYDDGRLTTFKTYDDNLTFSARLTRFNNVDYLVVARGEKVEIYPKPLDLDGAASKTYYLEISGGVDMLEISPGSQFVLAGEFASGEQKMASFDLDTMTAYSFKLAGPSGDFQWLDNSHLVSTSDNRITLTEFDGQNSEEIVSASGRVSLSRDGKYLFSIGESAGGATLQRSKLVID